jgi:hypothetical protein
MSQTGTHGLSAADAPIFIIDGFLPDDLAAAMRRDIEGHFAKPEAHGRDTHQVWNYWFVPELYTYLRTAPEKVIEHALIAAFHQTLCDWSTSNLGMGEVTWPFLSLYVSGCRQGWHNDSRNGRFGFVYSLTRAERRTIGGETLILHEDDPFRGHLTNATAGRGLYEKIEPRFNRLLVFDDRLPHAVERVEGSMDPVDGRFVLHGHLSEGTAVVVGALSATDIAAPLNDCLSRFRDEISAAAALYHGPLTFRLIIGATGAVAGCEILLDRVIHPDPGHTEWEAIRARLIVRLRALQFIASSGQTTLIQPVLFGSAA